MSPQLAAAYDRSFHVQCQPSGRLHLSRADEVERHNREHEIVQLIVPTATEWAWHGDPWRRDPDARCER